MHLVCIDVVGTKWYFAFLQLCYNMSTDE